MADERVASIHDEISALRIDRGAPTRRRARSRVLLVGLAIAALVGAGALVASLTVDRPREVQVVYARRSEAGTTAGRVELQGSGYVTSGQKYVSLGVRVPGRIEAYLVEEGDRVKAGQPLVRLDAREYRARLRKAEASLALTRANRELRRKELARLGELVRRSAAPPAELDVKETELTVAEAEAQRADADAALARLDLDGTTLRAPIDGLVLSKLKELGEMAVPGGFSGSGDLVRLASTQNLWAEVDIAEADLQKVRQGQSVEVTPDAMPDRHYHGRVVRLAPQINRQKGTLKVEVRIEEPDEYLRLDMSARIAFLGDHAEAGPATGRVLAPRAAVRAGPGGPYVWVVTDKRVHQLRIRTAGEARDDVIVVEGLSGGEALVTGPDAGLKEGDLVRVATERS